MLGGVCLLFDPGYQRVLGGKRESEHEDASAESGRLGNVVVK